jgi:hypothetical protein
MRTDEEWLGNASESGSVAERETLTSKRSQGGFSFSGLFGLFRFSGSFGIRK